MRIGLKRHRITIQSKSVSQTSTGAENITWNDVDTVWAEIAPLHGREFLEAQRVHDEVVTRMRIRYYSGLTPEMHVTWGTHTYDILAILPYNERNREIELMLREIT